MDRSTTEIAPQTSQTLHTDRLKYGRCDIEQLHFWLSSHPTTSTEYTYSQLEDQTEAHTIAQMSQIIRRELSPLDFDRLKLPYEIEPFPEVDEHLGIPMPSANTKERTTSLHRNNGISGVSPQEAAIPMVPKLEYEPPEEPNQPSDPMRAFSAKPLIKLLTEAAQNSLEGLPKGYYRLHAMWLTNSLPLNIESKEVSDPDDMDETIASFRRERGDEFTLTRRKTPAGEYPHETYKKDVLWIKRWIEDWRDMLYINPQEMRLFIDKAKVFFYVSKTVAKCYDGRWFFHRPLDKNQLSTWELLSKRVRDGGDDDVREDAERARKRVKS